MRNSAREAVVLRARLALYRSTGSVSELKASMHQDNQTASRLIEAVLQLAKQKTAREDGTPNKGPLGRS